MRSKHRLFMAAGLVAAAVALGCQTAPQVAPAKPRTVIYGGGVKLDGEADMALVFERECPDKPAGFGLKQAPGGLDPRIKNFHVRISGPNLIEPITFDMGLDAFDGGANCQATSAFYGVPDGDYVIEFQGVDAGGGTIAFANHPVHIDAGQTLVETVKCDFNTGKLAVNIDCCVTPAPSATPIPSPTPTCGVVSNCQVPYGPWSAVEDAAGNLLVGTDGGLFKIATGTGCSVSQVYYGPQFLDLDIATGNTSDPSDDTIWLAGSPHLLHLDPAGNVLHDILLSGGPMDVAVHPDKSIWTITYSDNLLQHFDENGNLLGTFPVAAQPQNLDIDDAGNIWVASVSNTISKFAPDGTVAPNFPVALLDGGFPTGFSFDAAGNALVYRHPSRIDRISATGALTQVVPYDGNIGFGTNAIFGKDGDIFVASSNANMVLRYDNAGNFKRFYATADFCTNVLEQPRRLVLAENGDIIVLNTINRAVVRFTP